MSGTTHRGRQPGMSLAQNEPPRIIEFEPIPAAFTPRKPAPFRMDLSEILPHDEVAELAGAGQIVFHCVGDTGGVKRPEAQALVARGMEQSLQTDKMAPTFCYHLGDVIYYTGEVEEYWPQFYEPYEHYPLPIVAIPGNHDGEKQTQQSTSLLGFYQNFCAAPDTLIHESRDSGRKAMTQPWLYWTLTTPVATFIGLYTNVPEHGRISDEQRAWFRNNMALELQEAINESRRIPNMVLSAHVHNYQRIELQIAGNTIPFFVIGNGGYWNLHYLASPPGYQDPQTEAKLIQAIASRHGFMTFSISLKVINGQMTTVPRPHESWSDPNAYDATFDVFSYSAVPLRLKDGETVTLLPPDGTQVPVQAAGHRTAPSRHAAHAAASAQAHAKRNAAKLQGRHRNQ